MTLHLSHETGRRRTSICGEEVYDCQVMSFEQARVTPVRPPDADYRRGPGDQDIFVCRRCALALIEERKAQ